MFGHVAQMPQLLRAFGFEHAVVWRGVPAAVDRSGFWWEAPDGTSIRAEYMPDGYGNGSALPDDAKALVGQVAGFEGRWGDLLAGPILWMNGTDHQTPARGWAGWSPRPTPCPTTTTSASCRSPSTWRPRRSTGCRGGGASCAPAPGPTC